VQIDFASGQKVKIDKTVLWFMRIRATETVSKITLDAGGADVELQDSLIPGIRIEASE